MMSLLQIPECAAALAGFAFGVTLACTIVTLVWVMML